MLEDLVYSLSYHHNILLGRPIPRPLVVASAALARAVAFEGEYFGVIDD